MSPEPDASGESSVGRVIAVYIISVILVIGLLAGLDRFAGIDINRSALTVIGLYLIYTVWQKPGWSWDFATMQAWRRVLGDRGATMLWGAAGPLFVYLGLFTHLTIFK